MNRLSISVALAAASFCISASAAVYRWVDGEGHVHYTDKAVENSTVVNVKTGQPKEGDAGANLPADQVALKKAECEQKKKQYDSYKGASKIVETDSLGRAHEYTADEMKMLLERTQQAMQDSCGAAGSSTTTATSATTPSTPPAPQQ